MSTHVRQAASCRQACAGWLPQIAATSSAITPLPSGRFMPQIEPEQWIRAARPDELVQPIELVAWMPLA